MFFFGYQEEIDRQRKTLEYFMPRYCNVNDITFVPLSHKNLPSITKVMGNEIEAEKRCGSDIYFDVTGGESLILVAFGMLSSKYETPMHFFDIEKDKIFEIDEGVDKSISELVETRKVKFDIDMWIVLKGGAINYNLHKDFKSSDDGELEKDIHKLWMLLQKYPKLWNPFSMFIRNHLQPVQDLWVEISSNDLNRFLQKSNTRLNSVKRLKSLLQELNDYGIIQDLDYSGGICRYKYKSRAILNCLIDGGSVLELYVFYREREYADDCKIGVHLDWDGILHHEKWKDVLNEVDVLTLRGNIPTFISCKSGKKDANQILHALYELDTVSEKFGGK